MNAKGEMVLGFILTVALISSLTTLGVYKTSQNGVLKNNGKKIWCKVLNKGEDFCNEKYAFVPESYHWDYKVPVYVPDAE